MVIKEKAQVVDSGKFSSRDLKKMQKFCEKYREIGGTLEVLLILPVIWMMDVLCCFVFARYELGYWPKPYRPDPKDVINGAFLIVSTFGLIYTIMVSPLVAASYVVLGALKRISISKRLLASWSLPIFFFSGDRFFGWRIVEWILD